MHDNIFYKNIIFIQNKDTKIFSFAVKQIYNQNEYYKILFTTKHYNIKILK